jgi:predicted nucleic acid-binding protein
MAAESVVVDTSAIAAVLFGEPTGPEMASRLEQRALFAPTLIRYELANVCLKKERMAPQLHLELLSALRLYSRLGVQEVQVPTDGLVRIARETGLTAYDAAYLWLARTLGLDLVTLDSRLLAISR